MSHNLNFNKENKEYSFYSLKEKPWHGLGQVVQEAKTSAEVIKLAHLNYEVGLAKTYAAVGDCISPEYSIKCNTAIRTTVINNDDRFPANRAEIYVGSVVPGYFTSYRKDTNEVFGLVGSRYTVVQNVDCFDFFDSIIGEGHAKFETAGALGKGERIFITAKLPSNIRMNGKDDIIEQYLLLTTSHDGSTPIQAMFTNVRVVCNNTLNMALKDCSNKVVIKHTKSAKDKLDNAMKLMKLHRIYSDQYQEVISRLAKVNVDLNKFTNFVTGLYLNANELLLLEKNSYNIKTVNEISSNKKNKIDETIAYINNGVGQDVHRGTALWLYNGLTSYINNGMKYDSQEDKYLSITEGSSFKLSQKAFDLATSLM